MKEIWKPVPGWPKYSVSNLGRVKGVYRRNDNDGGILKNAGNEDRYMVRLHNGKQTKLVFVSRLVLLAFRGPPPENKPLALHKDDDRINDCITNLKWGNHQDNAKDADKNDRLVRGMTHGMRKLTLEQVMKIKALSGKSKKECYGLISKMAKEFGVTRNMVSKIKAGDNWKHV